MLATAYPHAVDRVELMETHISWVLLAGAFAYKIKKPLDLGFLDFTTPERRLQACEDEVRLNRRLAPTTYLGVVPVVQREGSAKIGGPGRIIDYAVWMQRLPAEGMLPGLLAQNGVTPNMLRQLARDLARFHAAAATGPGVDDHGAAGAIAANWEQNFAEMDRQRDGLPPDWELAALRSSIQSWLQDCSPMFETRQASGRIREGHGDLHSGNLCLVGRRIVPFDCLEFSARYRCGDVASDIAFLAMDLDQAGRPDLAWRFVTDYFRETHDSGLQRLIPFYACYRAFVRGKVRALRLGQLDSQSNEREVVAAQARASFDLALRYAQQDRPLLVATAGLPGSGKSSLAADLSNRQGMLVLSSDIARKRLAGYPPTHRASASYGEGLYDPSMTRRTYAAMHREAALWLRRGVSVILDGSYGDRHQRDLARRLAARSGARFQLIWVTCPDDERKRRIDARLADAQRTSDATWEISEEMRGRFSEPTELDPAELMVDSTGGHGADRIIERWLRPLPIPPNAVVKGR